MLSRDMIFKGLWLVAIALSLLTIPAALANAGF